MIVALIPTYGNRGYLEHMLEWLNNSGEVDAFELLRQELPLGSASARHELINQAVAKYGYNHHFLMLDDDCIFGPHSHIRLTSKIMEKEPDIGLLSYPLGGIISQGYVENLIVKHCWLINGKLLADGANYTPGEIWDSLDFCIQSYLLGYRNVITKEAIIWHDVREEYSIRWKLVENGQQSRKSGIAERYADYVDYIHEPYGINFNKKAIELHLHKNKLLNGSIS